MSKRAKRFVGLGVLSIFAVALILVACIVDLGDGQRRVVAGDITTDVIVPTYDEVVLTTDALSEAATAFALAPTADSLTAVRTAWKAAREPWKRTEAFRFGPPALQTMGTRVDQFPVDPPRIETELAGTDEIDAAYFEDLGFNKKGFHSVEYLIFGEDAAVLASLTTDPGADRRRAYIDFAARDIAVGARELRDAWSAYAARLADPGADNSDFPTIKASIDALVNECAFQAEVIADARIGKPKGTAVGGVPQPDLQESAPSDTSVDDMIGALESIELIYFGGTEPMDGKGISSLVRAQSAAVDRSVRTALDDAFTAVRAIPRPYTQALLDKRPEIETAYTAVQELQRVLATDVIATLGATLKFNDNDGD